METGFFSFDFKKTLPLAAFLFLGALVLFSVKSGEKKEQAAVSFRPENSVRYEFPPEPELVADVYLARIAGNSSVLLERKAGKYVAPASLAKLLTAAVVLDELHSSSTVFFSEKSRETEEKKSRVAAGETVLRDDALRLLLVSSANDAALALAETVGRKNGATNFTEAMSAFRGLMRKKSSALGLSSSSFLNPAGLDEDGQYSSARDIGVLAEYLWYNHGWIWEMTRTTDGAVKTMSGREYVFETTNSLLYEFPAIRGGKTGFTDKAGGALVVLYPLKNGEIAEIVILESSDRFGDGRKIINWLESTELN